jgi:hypothetical protein
MSEVEAQKAVDQINSHINEARKLVYEFYTRQGWKALGYSSWRECVVEKFDQAQRTLYQELNAAQVEVILRNCANDVGTIPEGKLRPLTPYKDEPEVVREAWATANERSNGNPTGRDVKAAVDEVLSRRDDLPGQTNFLAAEDEGDEEADRYCIKTEDDLAADRWARYVHDLNIFLDSLPRRGGIANLAREKGWSKARVKAVVAKLRQGSDTFVRCAEELEELL